MKPRTRARSLALQVLFEYDLSGHPPGTAFLERCDEEQLDKPTSNFANEIITGIIPLIEKIDKVISVHAPEWPLDQVAIIDRNIIRIALWEFAISECTPIKVAINEAIELSKVFGSDSSPRFVNGVLGSLATKQNEIHQHLAGSRPHNSLIQ